MVFSDPAFWRAGAISTITVMSIVLMMLTIDSLAAISAGGSHVPLYTVINQHIDYRFDSNLGGPLLRQYAICSVAEAVTAMGRVLKGAGQKN